MNFASLVTKVKAGWWLGDGSAVDQIAKSKTPMLFIHGDSDTFIPSFMVDEAYDAANVEKDKIVVERAGHGMSARVMGDEYWASVFDFINTYLNKDYYT